ncbi:uncharacterized protein FOMMEDRAFT_167953 [Fomitiporia mediterranea MF3/22]|uniref:uncharacterized protein n=1 Tax=Fomitiporia mediterranea (strain MF3/22) TaxID=694068 RepID=UPI00044095A6|nr:uncharacterized protein FOMMEDRAFT_167953 [Fomitiporia mediterranea MF3/22]EJD02804.1 hypothetical protein FOMMEDRAFT_167953 [Fomitiporia mediterranea MF3/22]
MHMNLKGWDDLFHFHSGPLSLPLYLRRSKSSRSNDLERQPLIRHGEDQRKSDERPKPYEKVADVLGALHAGKLPSQVQVERALRGLLRGGFFDVGAEGESGEAEGGGEGEREVLDKSVENVVRSAREAVEVVLQIGLEKNHDDKFQDLIYQLRELSSDNRDGRFPVDVESVPEVRVNDKVVGQVQQQAASAIPSQSELAIDIAAFLSSFRTLMTLVLTSSTFRLILGDLLRTAREFVADSAESVRRAAEQVEKISQVVETNVRPGSGDVHMQPVAVPKEPEVEVEKVSEEVPSDWETRSPKEVVLDRIEHIFRQAQASPKYNSALRTLLYLFRKYAERVSLASTAVSQVAQSSESSGQKSSIELSAPVIIPDPHFSHALEGVKVLLERFAGRKSLEPLLQTLLKTVHDISVAPVEEGAAKGNELRDFFTKVGIWLDTALDDPSFVASREGRDTASMLYDEGFTRFSQNEQLSEDVQSLLTEVNAFVDALKTDRSTNKLVNALETLHTDLFVLFGRTEETGQRAATHWRTTLLRAALGWLVPRVLRVIRVLPMPRFEYVSSMPNGAHIAAAVDALLLSAEESLIPDVLTVQEFAEVRVEVDEHVGAAQLTSPNARLLSAKQRSNDAGHGHLESASRIPLLADEDENQMDSSPSSKTERRKKTSVSSTSRIRVHVEGLRVAAHEVGYYASYARNSWLGYTDEGLLSVDIGHAERRGEGLTIDIELETDSNSKSLAQQKQNQEDEQQEEPLFRVVDVHTSLPGLALHIAHSRHWILNSILLAPLAGPIGRVFGTRVLNAQVRSGLEALEQWTRDVKVSAGEMARIRRKEADEELKETNVWDWWDAILEKFGAGSKKEQNASESDQEEDDGEEQRGVYTETHTEASLTGIVRTTIEQPEPESESEAPPPTENTMAIGVGSQLLPGKAEPTALGVERESPQEASHEVSEAAREAIEDVHGKVQDIREDVQGVAQKGIEEAVQARRTVEAAEERMQNQERRERRKAGWRSRAFDL